MAWNLLRRLSLAVFSLLVLVLPSRIVAQGCIKLLVPLPSGNDCLPAGSTPFDVIEAYFSELFPWIVGTAAGIAIAWCLVAGAAMVLHAGDDSKRGEAKQWFINAVTGLLIIVFSGMILNFLNPLFFKL